MPVAREEWWEVVKTIGDYSASELEREEAREVERLLLGDPEALKLVESYLRMLALLGAIGNESLEVPEAAINYAIRRAYFSAFLRQAEEFVHGLAGDYIGALTFYLNLRPATR